MGDQNYAGGQDDPPGRIPGMPLRMTPEELKVIKQCNSESFWYRCVPLGMLFIGGTQILTNRGFLKPHPKFGSFFKNLGAGLVAFVAGKVSYQDACKQKILQLQNSPMADAMRRGKNPSNIYSAALTGEYQAEENMSDEPRSKARLVSSEDYRGGDSNSDSNVQLKGLDEAHRPSVDDGGLTPLQKQAEQEGKKQHASYDDLRQQNRQEFEQRMAITQNSPPREQQPPSRLREPVPSYDLGNRAQKSASADNWENQPMRGRSSGMIKNKYGDIVEE